MSYYNMRRKLEVLLLLAFILFAFAAGDTWIAWVSLAAAQAEEVAMFQ